MKCEWWIDQHDTSVGRKKKSKALTGSTNDLPNTGWAFSSEGHGFDSCRGLRNFFVPRLCHVDQFTFHISLPSLKFTIIIHLSLLTFLVSIPFYTWNNKLKSSRSAAFFRYHENGTKYMLWKLYLKEMSQVLHFAKFMYLKLIGKYLDVFCWFRVRLGQKNGFFVLVNVHEMAKNRKALCKQYTSRE